MKVLRVILSVLALLILGVIVNGYLRPAEFNVSRELIIDAPAEAIWPHIVDLRAADNWNAWLQMDPETVKEYSDEQGKLGSWATWKSQNPNVGEGKQTLTKLDPYKRVESKLELAWGDPPLGYYELDEQDGKTNITYGFQGANSDFVSRIMGGFFNMEKMVGPMFETGLANMKEIVEAERSSEGKAEEKTYGGFTISKASRPQKVLVGNRGQIPQAGLQRFYAKHLGMAQAAVTKDKLNMDGMPCGVFFDWNDEEKTCDLFAGIPVVADTSLSIAGVQTQVIPASKVYYIDYYGPYEGSVEAHNAMDQMIKENGLGEPAFVIEEYMNDPTGIAPEEIHTRVQYLF